jgi:hypothetical protein
MKERRVIPHLLVLPERFAGAPYVPAEFEQAHA